MTTLAITSPSVVHLIQVNPAEYVVRGFLGQYATSPRTHEAFTLDLKHYVTWLYDRGLNLLEVRRPDLDDYLNDLRTVPSRQTGRLLAPATVGRRFGTVIQLYKWAHEEEMIQRNPAARVRRPKHDRDEQRRTVLNSMQFSVLLHAARAHSPRAHCLVALLGMIGLRISEACGLDVTSVTQHQGYDVIRFTGKGGKVALMPLPVPVSRAVKECIGDRELGPLLLNASGRRMTRTNATSLLRQLGEASAIGTDFSPHSLRRTFCTSGLSSGVPIHDMSIAMRHASTATTSIYDRLKDSLDRNASHRVASYLSGMAG
jgi:integrase/recombinase XerD